MINWISAADPSRRPEIGKPVFIRGTGHSVNVAYTIAYALAAAGPDELGSPWFWEPHGYDSGYDGRWDFGTVTHWAEIPEGLFNEPTA